MGLDEREMQELADAVDAAIKGQRLPQSLTFYGTANQCAIISSQLVSYCHALSIPLEIVPTGGGWRRKHYVANVSVTYDEAVALNRYFALVLASFQRLTIDFG